MIAEHGSWALGSDGVQWILYRRVFRQITGPNQPHSWHGVSFVRSTRDVLARCMREKGVGAVSSDYLLNGLPDSFEQWKASSQSSN